MVPSFAVHEQSRTRVVNNVFFHNAGALSMWLTYSNIRYVVNVGIFDESLIKSFNVFALFRSGVVHIKKIIIFVSKAEGLKRQ